MSLTTVGLRTDGLTNWLNDFRDAIINNFTGSFVIRDTATERILGFGEHGYKLRVSNIGSQQSNEFEIAWLFSNDTIFESQGRNNFTSLSTVNIIIIGNTKSIVLGGGTTFYMISLLTKSSADNLLLLGMFRNNLSVAQTIKSVSRMNVAGTQQLVNANYSTYKPYTVYTENNKEIMLPFYAQKELNSSVLSELPYENLLSYGNLGDTTSGKRIQIGAQKYLTLRLIPTYLASSSYGNIATHLLRYE